jgi:hypothetical protein
MGFSCGCFSCDGQSYFENTFKKVAFTHEGPFFKQKVAPALEVEVDVRRSYLDPEADYFPTMFVIHSVRDPQEGGESEDPPPLDEGEGPIGFVFQLRNGFSVVSGDIGDDFFRGIVEADQMGRSDEVIGVFVVRRDRDELADVVE